MQVVGLPGQTTRGARLETPEAGPFGGGGRGSAPDPAPAKTRRKRAPRTALATPVTAVRETRNDYPMCGKAKIAVFPVPDLRRNAPEPRDANAPVPEGCPEDANPPDPEKSSNPTPSLSPGPQDDRPSSSSPHTTP